MRRCNGGITKKYEPCAARVSGYFRRFPLLDFDFVPLRIGLFGGTFDPPHLGHLVTAINVRHTLSLDLVVLMVANDPWQKTGARTVTPAADRLAMVQAAVGSAHEGDEAGVSVTGKGGCSIGQWLRETDLHISVPHERTARIQGVHLLALHCICDGVDTQLLGDQEKQQ